MKGSEILARARALIRDEGSWCRRAYATDANGRSVGSYNDSAIRFCAVGAFYRATWAMGMSWDTIPPGLVDILDNTSRALHGQSLTGVNDHLGHAAVLGVYDTAIALAEEGERT